MKQFISAIITAAGNGTRMNVKNAKQYIPLKGRMILQWTLDIFAKLEYVNEIILVVRKQDEKKARQIISEYDKKIRIVFGGQTRELSTFNGISALDDNTEIVICHDACRPFVTKEIIDRALKEIDTQDAVICTMPVKDTIKYCNKDNFVEYTPNRSRLQLVQTPQIFRKDLLEQAYSRVFDENIQVTDDSSLFELMGGKVKIVPGSYSNIKITTTEDLIYGEYILESRGKQCE